MMLMSRRNSLMRNAGSQSWNRRNGLLALRRRSNREELFAQAAELRRTLAANPADHGARYLLATSLYGLSLFAEARTEWETVLSSGDENWVVLAANALNELKIPHVLVPDRRE